MHTLATTAYGKSLELFPEPLAMCLFTILSSACSNEILKKIPYISNSPITRKWVASPILGLGVTWMANQFSLNRDTYLGVTTAIAIIGSIGSFYFAKGPQQPEVFPTTEKIPNEDKEEEEPIQSILPKGLYIDPTFLSPEMITLLSFIQPILKQINTKELFREPGNKDKVKALMKKLNSSKKTVSVIIQGQDIKIIASVFKDFLKKYDLLDGIKEKLLNMEEPDVQLLKEELLKLGEEKREQLRIVLYCLSEIAGNSSVNNMTAKNLSNCIGLSLIYYEDPAQAFRNAHKVNSITQFLIENYEEIYN